MKLGLFRRIAFNVDPENYQDQINELANKDTQAFLQWLGLDVTVNGYVFEGDDITAPMTPASYTVDGFAMKAIKAFKTDNNIECEYNLAVGGGHNSRCGQALSAPSFHGVVYTNMPNYACNVLQTTCHEFIHMLGRQHSGYRKTDGTTVYHADANCLMGSAKMLMPNAGHMCELGLVDYLTVTATRLVKLMPLELNQRDMLPDHWRAVRIGDYYLSIRKQKGTPFPITFFTKSISVHEIARQIKGTEPTRDELKESKRFTLEHRPNINIGSNVTLPTGVHIECLEYDDEIATVKITFKETS